MFNNGPFEFVSKKIVYPGKGGWTFLQIPASLGASLKKRNSAIPKRGWGSFRVQACVNAICWQTSIFPDKDLTYLLPVKKSIRMETSMDTIEEVKFSVEILGGL